MQSSTHPKFVRRLASEYVRRYKDIGAREARQWAARVIGKDKVLEEEVKKHVAILIREILRGKK